MPPTPGRWDTPTRQGHPARRLTGLTERFETNSAGYKSLLAWLESFGDVTKGRHRRHRLLWIRTLDLYGNDCDRDPTGHEHALRLAVAHFISDPSPSHRARRQARLLKEAGRVDEMMSQT